MKTRTTALTTIWLSAGLALNTTFAVEPSPSEIPLYQGPAPGSEHWSLSESGFQMKKSQVLRNVVNPRLTVFVPAPEKNVGTAVIVAPGGGMMYLSIDDEGYGMARWLAERGFTAYVLKYRTLQMAEPESEFYQATVKLLMQWIGQVNQPSVAISSPLATHASLAVADGVQAIRAARSLAGTYNYGTDRIVTLGFSAGGTVAIGGAFQADPTDRPNYTAWIYSGIFARRISDSIEIPKDMPPVFMAVAKNDPLFRSFSMPLYESMVKSGAFAELHIYERGGHGFGIVPQGRPSDHWVDEFFWWLESHGLTKKPNASPAN